MKNGKKINFFQKPKTKETFFLLALVFIPLIHFVVFWVYVNAATIWKTFFEYIDSTGEYKWNGIDLYVKIFREWVLGIPANDKTAETVVEYHRIFWNSFRAILINIILYPIVIVASYAFYKKIRAEKFFRVCFYLPQLVSISILATIYINLFDPYIGPISLFMKAIGHPVDFMARGSNSMWTLIYIFAIWTGLGSNVIMLSGAMSRIPADIGEYCQLEGVGFWRELFQIVLPLIMPTLGVYLVNILLSVFAFMMQPMMVTGNDQSGGYFMTVGWYIFEASAKGTGDQIYASTLGLLLTAMITPFVIGLRILIKKITPDVQF